MQENVLHIDIYAKRITVTLCRGFKKRLIIYKLTCLPTFMRAFPDLQQFRSIELNFELKAKESQHVRGNYHVSVYTKFILTPTTYDAFIGDTTFDEEFLLAILCER